MRKIITCFILFILRLCSPILAQTAGTLDISFSDDGKQTIPSGAANAVAI